MQLLADLGMQTWEMAKEGIYFKGIFSFYDSLLHVCVFITREDGLAERQGEGKSHWMQMMGSKVHWGGLAIRAMVMGSWSRHLN